MLWSPRLLVGAAALWIAFAVTGLLMSLDSSILLELLPVPQVVGTTLMFCLLTPYLWWSFRFLSARVASALTELEPYAESSQVAHVRLRLRKLAPWAYLVIGLSLAFGLSQNRFVVTRILNGESFALYDLLFVLGNVILWTTIGVLTAWRLPISLALSRLGSSLRADVYQLQRFAPLARVSTSDVLIVASSMAFMPLQSLDAEFRLDNYLAGFLVGLFSAAMMFFLPMLGARRRIVELKQQRLDELTAALETTSRSDVPAVHTLTAHIDAVRSMPNLPINTQVITRIFAYVIIPPMAWVAAALVENVIDSL